jgi:hypothetical protein
MCVGDPPPIHGDPQARDARPHAGDGVQAEELRADRGPAAAVVDEQPLAPGRPARRHHAVLAEVERVVVEAVEVLEQRVAAQAPVAHHVVEALHHRPMSSAGRARSATGPGPTRPAKRSR